MHVLYNHRTKSADGQYVHIESLAGALAASGHHVTFCSPAGIDAFDPAGNRAMDAAAGEKKGVFDLFPRPFYELAELAYSVPAYWRLRKAARETKPAFIYERYNLFFLSGLWLRHQSGLPLLLEVNAPLHKERTRHGGLALTGLANWAERKVWRGADALLAVTQVLADELIAEGADPTRVHVVPNGIHASQFEEIDGTAIRRKYSLTDKTVLGFTGFVRDWHGVDMIVDYLASRNDDTLHLMIVGDGPHLDTLRTRATELGVDHQVTFTGVIQRTDIPGYIAAFDIALQPRVTEYASPLKLFEYMAAGKAIVAPAQPNIEEVLTDRDNAILFQPDHRDALGAALDCLTADPAIRVSLGAKARQTILDRDLTWEGNARRVLKIAESLIEERWRNHAE